MHGCHCAADPRGQRSDIDDAAVSALQHGRNEEAGALEHCRKIDGHDPAEMLNRHFPGRPGLSIGVCLGCPADAIDQNIRRTWRLRHGSQPRLDGIGIGEIKLDQAYTLVLGGQCLTRRDAEVDQRDLLALIQKCPRDAEADITAAAGDQNVISLDFHQLLPIDPVRPAQASLPANFSFLD